MTSPVEFFRTSSMNVYKKEGTEFEQEVKRELFDNEIYLYELIEKGFISPDGTVIINPIDFQRKLTEAIQFARQSVGNQGKIATNRFMHLLGASVEDTPSIPRQAYDTSLYETPILGQNRIAYMRMGNIDYRHGLMLGGLGTGGIERTPQGIFRRVGFTFVGQNTEDKERNIASQFHIYMSTKSQQFSSALCTEKPEGDKLNTWKWKFNPDNGSYHALYPMEWHIYHGNDMPGKITITSFSPIIKENYQETSYPVIVYKVKIKNTSAEPMTASFMFTMQNLVGWKPNTANNTRSPEAFREVERKNSAGINPIFNSESAKDFISEWEPESKGNHNKTVIDENGNTYLILTGNQNTIPDTNGEIAIAIPKIDGLEVSYVTSFDANGDGSEVSSFYENGQLSNNEKREIKGKDLAGAIAFKVGDLAPGREIEVPVILSYDFPISKQGETILLKRYTKFFGESGQNAIKIAATALENYKKWEESVRQSQKEIALDHCELPDWYQGAVLNKLNLLQTNSIGWFTYDNTSIGGYPHAPATEGLHLLAESNKVDYNHVETMDVRSYDFARALFWPELDQNILTYYSETIPQEDSLNVFFNEQTFVHVFFLKMNYIFKRLTAKLEEEKNKLKTEKEQILNAVLGSRKVKFSTPHDIWSSATGPMMNTYTHQNANLWPGLPPVGMLQALRNFDLTGDYVTFEKQYQGFSRTLDYAENVLDQNNDSIPDFLIPKNESVPLQAF
jgi:non-lysosomal glucosylceramidase